MSNKEFQDSVEATEFLEKLQSMLHDPRLAQWVKDTDDNFNTDACQHLSHAKEGFDRIFEEVMGAE